MIFEIGTVGLVQRGYVKGARDPERYRFLFVPRVQYAVFEELFTAAPPSSPRDVLDHFFSSYFNAWLDYQGDLRQKCWITAFAPRLAQVEASVANFFASYPDGRLIQLIRDPRTWYPSAKHHRQSEGDSRQLEDILQPWLVSTESILRNKTRYGDKVVILRFEDLVADTEATMRQIANMIGIEYDPILLEPTFNGRSMRANSSFAVARSGVIKTPLNRDSMLSAEDRRLIESQGLALYEKAATMALDVAGTRPRVGVGL
jgi:Sulfotransferase family